MNDSKQDFIFISYSHKDERIFNYFKKEVKKLKYNTVCDKVFRYDEDWERAVRMNLENENCKGALIILSLNSVVSKAVLFELELIKQLGKNKIFCLEASFPSIEALGLLVENHYSEEEQEVFAKIAEHFNDKKLYAIQNQIDSQKLEETFNSWGMAKYEFKDAIDGIQYTSEIEGEKQRLNLQQQSYHGLDVKYVEEVIKDKKDLVVLDLGCANGELTMNVFDDERIKLVIGVDYNINDIEDARSKAKKNGKDKFKFYCVDLDEPDVVERIGQILIDNRCGRIDVVFGALVLQHLKNAQQLLTNLKDIMSDDGVIMLRGADDGGKTCYPDTRRILYGESGPDADEHLFEKIISEYAAIVQTSDRFNARKMPYMLSEAGFSGIKMYYEITDTCGMSEGEKMELFHLAFDFRGNRLEQVKKDNAQKQGVIDRCDEVLTDIQAMQTMFRQDGFWYCVTTYYAIAKK